MESIYIPKTNSNTSANYQTQYIPKSTKMTMTRGETGYQFSYEAKSWTYQEKK